MGLFGMHNTHRSCGDNNNNNKKKTVRFIGINCIFRRSSRFKRQHCCKLAALVSISILKLVFLFIRK